MWAFFSRRLRLWLMLAVGLPVLRRLLGGAGDALDSRRGPTRLSRSLRGSGNYLSRYERRGRRRRG